MKLPGAASVDRFLHPLVASTILLGVLLIWQRTYDESCLALVFPGLVCFAIFFGQLEYRLERKRFAVDYYLDPGSSLRGRFRGSWLPVLISVVTAVPLGIFLVVFAALSRYTDWLFLGLTAAIAPLLFVGLSSWPGRHFRRDDEGSGGIAVAEILTARLAGWVLMALIVVTYVYLNYRVIPGPAYIYPDSLQLTVEAFTVRVHSACPAVDGGLRAAAGIEGLSWYLVTSAATATWTPGAVKVVVWAGFFVKAALAITGFVRGIEGSILVVGRFVARNRKGVTDVE